MVNEERADDGMGIVPGYANLQIAKALRAIALHPDAETCDRARSKVAQWMNFVRGCLQGNVDVGSRTPVKDVPAWATLEVVKGGFATGQLLAEGPLRDFEQSLLASPESLRDARRHLNAYYLSDEGLAELQSRLHSGCYDVSIPEEGALLVVAWLVEHDQAAMARELLDTLGPFLSRLRFYPVPVESPQRFGTRVHLETVRDTIASLQISPNSHILAQKEAIEIWAPMYDQTVDLFLDTVEGPSPKSFAQALSGMERIEGGWPCRRFSQDWAQRAQAILDDYARLRKVHKLCGAPDRPHENFTQLRNFMQLCIRDPAKLTPANIARIRTILGRYVARRGEPSSPRVKEIRARQADQSRGPTFHEVAQIVTARLKAHPQHEGLDDVAHVTGALSAEEAQQWKTHAGVIVPPSLCRKIERCLCETIEVLVAKRVVTSADTLARILPQLTSGLRAAGISDASLRQLYSVIYRAFRRRRSLLLLNLQSQVKIEELPWVAAIDMFREESLSARELARQTLEEIVALAITSFPQAILPNKLLQELRALDRSAGTEMPLLDELAADIFMGTFTEKFVQAAKLAASLLQGTLYERYFRINYARIRNLPDAPARKSKQSVSRDDFANICFERVAGVKHRSSTAINGMVIEQQQIVTTQNLATLLLKLELTDKLRGRLTGMAEKCFIWICRRQQIKSAKYHDLLIMMKNTAYAWRQMVLFLSLAPQDELQPFLGWCHRHLDEQTIEFRNRFTPVLSGLERVAGGGLPERSTTDELTSKPFVGWSAEKHWLMP